MMWRRLVSIHRSITGEAVSVGGELIVSLSYTAVDELLVGTRRVLAPLLPGSRCRDAVLRRA